MLIIRKTILIILAAAAAAAVAVTAASAYGRIIGSEEMNASELKFLAEQYLFAGILLTIIISAGFLLLIIRSRNIHNELDRLIRQERQNPASAKKGLLKLGTLGSRLDSLYMQIEEVSEKRGLKISALSAAAEFLSLNIDRPIIIIDITGRIVQISRGYLERSGKSRNEMIDKDISSVISGIQIKAVLSRLDKKHLPAKFKADGRMNTWIPLYNNINEISYIAVIQP